ncbi:hypothetical protein [Clostridium sp. UBA6640]|uniref:hypothetical protein n=1 Tax=Clostridium sp. UBA6640 TaxID=1946370 RepID=UPI0025BA7F6B|nr:hypothetical protein [Clostridium sp. UBA6640]
MKILFGGILHIAIRYLAVWITLFFHEFSHAFFGWLFGVCKSPISIGYLPVVKLPMAPLVDQNKLEMLDKYKQILIHSGGLLMNLSMFILVSILILVKVITPTPYMMTFLLLFIMSNFAELESYITFGAIKPISDVKFILKVTGIKNYIIYIPGLILLIMGVYFLQTYIIPKGQFGYLIFFAVFYTTACCSRIILTRPSSKI